MVQHQDAPSLQLLCLFRGAKPGEDTFAHASVEPVSTQVRTTEKLLEKPVTRVLLLLTHLTEPMRLITGKSSARRWLFCR